MLVLDSGGFTALSARDVNTLSLLRRLRTRNWPPVVPSVVLVESLQGDGVRDAAAHRLLKSCVIQESVPVATARRAAQLRTSARRGSAVDAVVVAVAEPGGHVLTGDVGDIGDLGALAASARDVTVVAV